jgi:hypothetical protein
MRQSSADGGHLLHEKNLVLLNLLRDVMENETHLGSLAPNAPDDEIHRALKNRATRRKEILCEIQVILAQEGIPTPVEA